jgi:hypothetical protein
MREDVASDGMEWEAGRGAFSSCARRVAWSSSIARIALRFSSASFCKLRSSFFTGSPTMITPHPEQRQSANSDVTVARITNPFSSTVK